MALSILDGNQSATTLSTILSSGQHITAHTVISLGTQAITDIVNATSANLTNTQLRASAVTVGGTVTVGNSLTISSLPAISGTVTANVGNSADFIGGGYTSLFGLAESGDAYVQAFVANLPAMQVISGTVTIGAGTAQIGSVTASLLTSPTFSQAFADVFIERTSQFNAIQASIGSALPAGTNQIGSVTASISGTVPISISSVTVGNSVTIGSLPAISGTVTANTFALQGTAVTTSNFTSTTASTVLANYNATRQVLTIFNEGAGNLHIAPGATCTTIAYQVRLSAGDYFEVPNHQTTITHSAVFATAGTARVTEVS